MEEAIMKFDIKSFSFQNVVHVVLVVHVCRNETNLKRCM